MQNKHYNANPAVLHDAKFSQENSYILALMIVGQWDPNSQITMDFIGQNNDRINALRHSNDLSMKLGQICSDVRLKLKKDVTPSGFFKRPDVNPDIIETLVSPSSRSFISVISGNEGHNGKRIDVKILQTPEILNFINQVKNLAKTFELAINGSEL